jgi:hypothetical protein
VTLYIPSDTPPEVIHYMNRLKADGMFSQGIMDIVTRYVLHEHSIATPVIGDSRLEDIETSKDNPGLSNENFHETERFLSTEPVPEGSIEEQEDLESKAGPVSNSQKKFSLAQLFRQAQRNAGKLLHDTENEGNERIV